MADSRSERKEGMELGGDDDFGIEIDNDEGPSRGAGRGGRGGRGGSAGREKSKVRVVSTLGESNMDSIRGRDELWLTARRCHDRLAMPSTRSEVADDDQNRTRGKAPTISLAGAAVVVVEEGGGVDEEARLVVGGGASRSALASRGVPRAGVRGRGSLMHDVYYVEDGPAEKCWCMICIVWAMILPRNVCPSLRLQC